jgi:hypothetical protein
MKKEYFIFFFFSFFSRIQIPLIKMRGLVANKGILEELICKMIFGIVTLKVISMKNKMMFLYSQIKFCLFSFLYVAIG